jgi:hypothetical protein
MMKDSSSESPDLEAIAQAIRATAKSYQGDSLALLGLLRMLEGVHREIREGLFQAALPTNRQALYALLRDIEAQGGWPYIYSRQLRALINELVVMMASPAKPDETETESERAEE